MVLDGLTVGSIAAGLLADFGHKSAQELYKRIKHARDQATMPFSHDIEYSARFAGLRASRALMAHVTRRLGLGFDVIAGAHQDSLNFIKAADKALAKSQKEMGKVEDWAKKVPDDQISLIAPDGINAAFKSFQTADGQQTGAILASLAFTELVVAGGTDKQGCPKAIRDAFHEENDGWVELYRYCLGEEFKTKDRFRSIWLAYKLSDIDTKLDDLVRAQRAALQANVDGKLVQSIDQILTKLEEMDATLGDIGQDVNQILELAIGTRARVDHLTTLLGEAFAPLSLDLHEADSTQKRHHFRARALPVIGRDEEWHSLLAFTDAEKGFRWMQLAGAGGQGKSRLAFELAKHKHQQGWDAGLIGRDALTDFSSRWAGWQPQRPTLILADYIIARTELLGPLLRRLSARDDLNWPVRLVLIERGRWDRVTVGGSADPFGREARASWFEAMLDVEAQHAVLDCRAEPDLVELTNLGADHLVNLVQQWAQHQPACARLPNAKTINDRLRSIDPTGRPLFAYFLGEALAAGEQTQGWNRDGLLDATLRRQWKDRCPIHFNGAVPSPRRRSSAFDLATIATMIAGFTLQQDEAPDDQELRQALALADAPVDQNEPSFHIPALEPDLLGEWFVLAYLDEGGKTSALAEKAWSRKPKEMAAFLERLARDFPVHDITFKLLEGPNRDSAAWPDFRNAAASISMGVARAIQVFPNGLLDALNTSAETDRRAAILLELYKWNGFGGIDKDETIGIRVWHHVAEAGDGLAMALLGQHYLLGRGVEKDPVHAVNWFRKAANAGNSYAAVKLGQCYQEGVGVEENHVEAVCWYRQGAQAGHGMAMGRLGHCYQYGNGVDQDLQQAVQWYQKGADAGDGMAMCYLGHCYERGIVLEKDSIQAVHWYRMGANRGDSRAMTSLGLCHQDGIGLNKDLHQAVHWFQKAAKAGYSLAMPMLGLCYASGKGVERDLDEAILWLTRAVDLGAVEAEELLEQVRQARDAATKD